MPDCGLGQAGSCHGWERGDTEDSFEGFDFCQVEEESLRLGLRK